MNHFCCFLLLPRQYFIFLHAPRQLATLQTIVCSHPSISCRALSDMQYATLDHKHSWKRSLSAPLTKNYSGDKSKAMWHAWGKKEMHAGFWWGNLTERDHLEYPREDGTIIIKRIFRTWDGKALTGLIWLKIGTSGWRL